MHLLVLTSSYIIQLLFTEFVFQMHECRDACYLEKPPKGKHSTKGIGKTYPNPEESKKLGDVEVPLGKPKTEDLKTSLLYNEYPFLNVCNYCSWLFFRK